jgi:hypothetical protein
MPGPDPPADAWLSDRVGPAGPAGSWFGVGGLELNAFDDKSDTRTDPGDCLHPEDDLRIAGDGSGACRALRPGTDETTIFTLPTLAVSAWALIIAAVAGTHHLYRRWRLRRWLQRLRAQGLVPNPAARHGDPARRAARRGSRKPPGSRSRAA